MLFDKFLLLFPNFWSQQVTVEVGEVLEKLRKACVLD